ncbi:hypothetical protein FS837_007207 [Tulasnella sp. UAMH 9824]|nr:hypothetical protein FS837_007207 [Tulasnella sp. UAMH 9824]
MNSAQYTYVDPVNGNLVCCICRNPFIDPVSTTSCSHTFCSECIASALLVSQQCPVDRSPLTSTQLQPAATIVRNLVDELIVECPHAPAGCTLTCQRQHLPVHLSSNCDYVQVQCSQEGCTHTVLRKDLGKHSADCTHRLVECEACGRDVRLSEIESHPDECPATEITCIHCAATLPRASLSAHLGSCDLIPIPCTHSSNGCSWVGPRHLLDTHHLQLCPYEAIKGFFAVHSARQKDLELENAELRRRLEDTERTVRSHQRDLERAKVKLGPWFQPMGPETPPAMLEAGSLASSQNSTNSGAGTPTRPENRRRLSVPFNSAVFGVEDTPDSISSVQNRRSTVSTAAPERHAESVTSGSRPNSFDDPYAAFTASNPMAHPILTGTGGAGPSTFYRAHSSNSNPVAPLNLSGSLEGTLSSLRSSIVSLSQSLESLERKQDIMLTTETLRMHEDVASLRAIVHGLRMQVHNIMMDRNSYFTNRTAPTIPIGPGHISQTLSRQPSSPNLATTSNATVGVESMHRPSASVGGTSYTVSQFPMSSFAEDGDTAGPAQYLNQRPPIYYNLSPNIITSSVRRGPEGKL